jgi:hypothetical protein
MKIRKSKYRNSVNVECEVLCHTSNHWAVEIVTKGQKVSINTIRKTFNRFSTKAAILVTSHIIRKVLQSETWSLSDGVYHCFKGRSAGGKETCDRR